MLDLELLQLIAYYAFNTNVIKGSFTDFYFTTATKNHVRTFKMLFTKRNDDQVSFFSTEDSLEAPSTTAKRKKIQIMVLHFLVVAQTVDGQNQNALSLRFKQYFRCKVEIFF